MDIDGAVKNDLQNLQTYRTIALYPDVDIAVQDIVDEAVPNEEETAKVSLNLENLDQPDNIKDILTEEFETVLKLLKFDTQGSDLFRRWYIDGRLYYHLVMDEKNTKKGIHELRYVDPQKIRKIKNVKKERTNTGVEVTKTLEEYYLYNDKGLTEQTTQGVELTLDSIIYFIS